MAAIKKREAGKKKSFKSCYVISWAAKEDRRKKEKMVFSSSKESLAQHVCIKMSTKAINWRMRGDALPQSNISKHVVFYTSWRWGHTLLCEEFTEIKCTLQCTKSMQCFIFFFSFVCKKLLTFISTAKILLVHILEFSFILGSGYATCKT